MLCQRLAGDNESKTSPIVLPTYPVASDSSGRNTASPEQ